jgi:hypothetical protein
VRVAGRLSPDPSDLTNQEAGNQRHRGDPRVLYEESRDHEATLVVVQPVDLGRRYQTPRATLPGLCTGTPSRWLANHRGCPRSRTSDESAKEKAARQPTPRVSPNQVVQSGRCSGRSAASRRSPYESLEELHGHRDLRILGKGEKGALVPLPPALGRWLATGSPRSRRPVGEMLSDQRVQLGHPSHLLTTFRC